MTRDRATVALPVALPVALLAALLQAHPAHAQRDTARVSLLAPREVVTLTTFTAASLALLPFDSRLSHRLAMNPARPGRGTSIANAVASLGDPGSVIIAGGTLIAGYALRRPHVADVGRHLSEAVLVSGTLTTAGKAMVGRARPRTAGLYEPFAFTPFRPANGHVSYPSGHTSAAFATAAVLDRELGRSAFAMRHRTWSRVATAGLYTTATAVGVSRVVQRAHWGSDVLAGAGLGIASGWWTVRWQHAQHR